MKQILAILLALILCVSAAGTAVTEETEEMTLLAINVRKADALLLRSGSSVYLIDTGTKKSFDALYAVLREEGITRLTGVVITHTDMDHAGGLAQLVDSGIEIENVYASAYYNKKNETKHPAVKALKGTGMEVVFLSSGDSLPLDGGRLSVLGPLEKDDEKENNNSLVLLAEGGGGSILLAGDMEFPEESDLLSAGVIPQADVLKIGNHGDNDATSEALLNAVQPKVAVISTSTEEKSSTPSSRVLRLLSKWNVEVFQTQEAKTGILVTIRDGNIDVEIK